MEALFEGLVWLALASRKFPKTAEVSVGVALGDEEFAIAEDQTGSDFDGHERELPAYALINETHLFHLLGIEEIAAVEEARVREEAPGFLQIELVKLGPLGGDHERIATFGHIVHYFHVGDVGQNNTGFWHGLRIVNAEFRAFFLQMLAELDGGGKADVIGVLLEGKTEHTDGFIFEHPEGIGDFFDESLHLPRIDPLHFLEQREIVAELLGDFDESAEVFREATSAEAKAGIQKAAADAGIHAHAVRDLLNVCAARFANNRDGVDVGNFQREKGIGRVLDQLRGVDIRDDDRRLERLVDGFHGSHGALGAHAHDHAVGLHEIIHGETFAKELRVADHVEVHLG